MEWANFIAKSLCKWAREQVGKGVSFGDRAIFQYDERWPGEVPVFHKRTFIFTDSDHEIRLKIDDLDANIEVFLRMRDLYFKPLPGVKRPEDCFRLPDIRPHTSLLDYVEYSCRSLLMRARLKQEVYRDINRYGNDVFDVLNNLSFRSILGAMHNLGPVA